jgi:hypothetical protein
VATSAAQELLLDDVVADVLGIGALAPPPAQGVRAWLHQDLLLADFSSDSSAECYVFRSH